MISSRVELPLADRSLFQTRAFVGGAWIDGRDGDTFPVANPATGELLARVADLRADETRRAIEAAASAFPSWRDKTAKERALVLRRWFELMMLHQEDLATLLTAEQGKPLHEARGEVAYGASFVEWFAEEGKRVYGDVIAPAVAGTRLLVLKQPVGVVAAITPWNFPIAMITRKVAPALAAGCSVVVKPSEETPLSALALAVLAERAGVPAGVLNIVTGSDPIAIGRELTRSSIVRKLTFTGSTHIGKRLMRDSADTVKKVSMELGGNAPFIVFEDADVDAAVEGAMVAKFRNAGQTCICANRILVQSSIYDAFAAKFTASVKALRVGNGFSPGIEQGPLVSARALAKVEEIVAGALRQGSEVMIGGGRHEAGSLFFEPTVLTKVTSQMRVAREEVFGPVAPLLRFETEAEAIRMANDTEAGLAAYLYTHDVGRVWRVAEGLDYGMVGINEARISNEVAPFGGVKESGIGREGSKYGIEEFLEVKYLCLAIGRS